MTEIIQKNTDETAQQAQWMTGREQSMLLQESEKTRNESVKHVRHGTGRVAEVVQNHMMILFGGEARGKVFAYPDAPERFPCFDDPILQKRAEAAAVELKKERTEGAKQRLVVCQLYEAKRKQEQTELLKKRRKTVRERLARGKMVKVIQKKTRNKDESKEESKNGGKAESTAGKEVKRKVLKKGIG